MNDTTDFNEENRVVTFDYYLNHPNDVSKNEEKELIKRAGEILKRHDNLPSTIARIEKRFNRKLIEIEIDGKINYLLPSNQKSDNEYTLF